jgi:hypothetical protein
MPLLIHRYEDYFEGKSNRAVYFAPRLGAISFNVFYCFVDIDSRLLLKFSMYVHCLVACGYLSK